MEVATPIYEVKLLTQNHWTNITSDVVDDGVSASYGVQGNGPSDSIAGSGQCQFRLRNDARGTKPLGYYSPSGPNCRGGWTFGIPFRVTFNYGLSSYTRFYGKIGAIDPDTGPSGRRQVAVTAYDIMRDLAGTDIREIGIQVGKTESEIIEAVLAALPTTSQPLATDIDAGVDIYPYALDNLGGSVKALSIIADAARSAFSFVATKGDGTFIVRNRHSRVTGSSVFTFDGDMNDMQVPSDLSNVFNLVRVTIHPKTVDAAATTVLFTLTGSVPSISPGETITIWGNYMDAANAQKLVGGLSMVVPIVSGTDYAGNAAADGSGTDLTSSLSVTTAAFASVAKFEIVNVGTQVVYLIAVGGTTPKLQIRGKGVYDRGPQTYQSYSAQTYGTRPFNLDMPYQNDPDIGQSAADYVQATFNSLAQQMRELSFVANLTTSKMLLAMTVEPGDRVVITEPVTGLTLVGAIIQSISFEILEKIVTYKFGLAPSSVFSFWQWGIVGASEWGVTTRYGF